MARPLLVWALRHAGYRCRFVLGRLSAGNRTVLLRGMYPAHVPPPGTLLGRHPYDPGTDPRFASVGRDHVWVEVDLGPGRRWLPLDPSFPRAKVGQAYGLADRTFDAANEKDLSRAVTASLRPTYQVVDADGDVVGHGSVGGKPVTVKPGTYSVRVLTSPVQTVDGVEVSSGATKAVRLGAR